MEVVTYAGNPTYLGDRGRRNTASLNLLCTEKQKFPMTSSLGIPKDPWTNGLSLGCARQQFASPQPAAPTLLMKDANRLLRHLICSFSSLFTLCTVGSISSSRGTSRLSLTVTGVMHMGGPQAAPARYPKPGMPHLEATRGLPRPTLHRLRDPRQPKARRPPAPPGRQGPLLTS